MAQTPLFEGFHTGGFLVSQANGHRSIDRALLAAGQSLAVGAYLGKTAGGKYTFLSPTSVDGSQICAGLLYDSVDATSVDTHCAVVARSAEVNGSELNSGTLTAAQIAQAKTELATVGIIVR